MFLFSGGAAICMDLGHLTLKRGTNQSENTEESFSPKVKTQFFDSSMELILIGYSRCSRIVLHTI